MNPFEKLKLTIDRIGLQYIPSNDQQTITGDTIYKYTKTQEIQQNDHVPYFRTQGVNEQSFKKHSAQFREEQIEELKAVYTNQQKNLMQEITSLNKKLLNTKKQCEQEKRQNEKLREELDSYARQNNELRACIIDLQEKKARKMSQSGVLERQRKLKEEIDRINMTVTELAKELNSQKTNRKSLQKQLEASQRMSKQVQQQALREKQTLERQLEIMKEELQKRAQLLEHSIKSSRDDKMAAKRELAETRQRYQQKIESMKQQFSRAQSQIYSLKNEITEHKYAKESLLNQQNNINTILQTTRNELNSVKSKNSQLQATVNDLKQKLDSSKLQIAYLDQQLEAERSNTKVKLVQIKDEAMQMQLAMYKKQCKELLKQKSIWETVRKENSEYTIVSENLLVLSKNQ